MQELKEGLGIRTLSFMRHWSTLGSRSEGLFSLCLSSANSDRQLGLDPPNSAPYSPVPSCPRLVASLQFSRSSISSRFARGFEIQHLPSSSFMSQAIENRIKLVFANANLNARTRKSYAITQSRKRKDDKVDEKEVAL